MRIARLSIPLVIILAIAPALHADDFVLYSNLPNPLPPNLPSMPYEADSASEFGGLIQLAGGGGSYAQLNATVEMSDWAYLGNWSSAVNGTTITTSGFTLPMTLTLYSVGAGNTVGGPIASEMLSNAFIPWRPDPTSGCGGTTYLAGNGLCYNGLMTPVEFNFTNVTLPSQIIFGLAFNTTNYGANPTGVPGPYDSLNFALATAPPTVGSNPLPDTAYVNSLYAADYGTETGNLGTFAQGNEWTPYSATVELTAPSAVPEPSPWLLLATGLLVLIGVRVGGFKVGPKSL